MPATDVRPSSSRTPHHLRLIVFWLTLSVVVAAYFISARWHVRHGGLNTDEGFYAVGTRAVAQGEMPYRDFGFTQPPLVLYANALPLRVLGFGLFPQRAVNGAWAALALLIAGLWLARRARPAWALGLVLVFALTAPWMYFIHLGKTYGVTTLLVMLAAWTFLSLSAGPRRNFTLGLLAALGVASRLPAAPFFGLLWVLALWPGRRPSIRESLAAIAGVGLGGAVAILPFWLAAPEAAWFWTVDFHRISVPNKPWAVSWSEIAVLAPAVWLLVALALLGVAFRRQLLNREAGLLLAALTALAFNLLPRGTYGEYAVPFVLPCAIAAAALIYDMVKSRHLALALTLACMLLATQVLAAPLLLGKIQPERRGSVSQWLPPSVPAYNPGLPAELATARHIVESSLAPTAPFIGSNLILAAETGRPVPAELRMGSFSFTEEMSPERAARLHLATRAQLDAWFDQPTVTVLAFFRRWDLNYGWSMPSFTTESPAIRARTLDRLERDFNLVCNTDDFFLLERRRFRRYSFPQFGGRP